MDWMSGYSMVGLAHNWVFDPFRFLFSDEVIELYMVHICGLIFDLFEGFLLLFEKTRLFGLFFGCMFHIMNSQMFNIGMFPYTMLATMPIFFSPDWPRRLLLPKMPRVLSFILPTQEDPGINECFTAANKDSRRTHEGQNTGACVKRFVFLKKSFWICVAGLFVLIQLFLPWSHFITQVWSLQVHDWFTVPPPFFAEPFCLLFWRTCMIMHPY